MWGIGKALPMVGGVIPGFVLKIMWAWESTPHSVRAFALHAGAGELDSIPGNIYSVWYTEHGQK